MEKAKQDLLVLAAQKGNSAAFTALFEDMNAALLRFAYKVSRDEHIAQEAVQEAWINIATKLRRLDDPGAFKSWMFKSVRWKTIDLLRKKSRLPTETLDETHIEAVDVEPDNMDSSDTDVFMLVNTLPSFEREVIHLFYLEEMKIEEIAIVLNVPSGTVKSRLNRARKNLRERALTLGLND